jgi:hypothetical protein
MNHKEPIAPWGALNLETGETLTTHVKVTHGKCLVCGHFGDDCTGTAPAKTLVLKQVINLYPRMVELLKAAEPWIVKGIEKGAYMDCVGPTQAQLLLDQIQALLKEYQEG